MIHGRPDHAPKGPYDLVVVGGGIYGAFTALEAARRDLTPLLLERSDFGGETSRNSLRIVHGGLRYLQSLDLGRFRRSVAERRWMLRTFPELVRPLRCVMPLYGTGLRRRPILRAALALNDLLSWDRNLGVKKSRRIPRGRILRSEETLSVAPEIRSDGLQGGAEWHDAEVVDSARLLVEILRWATACGAVCLNYVEADELLAASGQVTGVTARDRVTDRRLEYRTEMVINCTGARAGIIARRFDREIPGLFHPSLAFNLLLSRPLRTSTTVAVAPPRPGGDTYFVRPWKGFTLAGTCHVPRPEGTEAASVRRSEVEAFLTELREAVPDFDVSPGDVREVLAGLVPVREPGSVDVETSPMIHDHGATGRTRGLVSVRGVKYTTARRVAEECLEKACAAIGGTLPRPGAPSRPRPRRRMTADGLLNVAASTPAAARRYVEEIVRTEAVVRPGDLLERRTDWLLATEDRDELRRVITPWLSQMCEIPDVGSV